MARLPMAHVLRLAFADPLLRPEPCQSGSTGAENMNPQRRFDNRDSSREALQTRTLIADIDRVVQILNSDIAAEEQQACIFDRSLAEYPTHARPLLPRPE